MHGDYRPFFGLEVEVLLVVDGCEQKLKSLPTHDERGKFSARTIHTIWHGVYDHFLIALLNNYATLPDYRTLQLSEVRFLYKALVPYLKRTTTPQTASK